MNAIATGDLFSGQLLILWLITNGALPLAAATAERARGQAALFWASAASSGILGLAIGLSVDPLQRSWWITPIAAAAAFLPAGIIAFAGKLLLRHWKLGWVHSVLLAACPMFVGGAALAMLDKEIKATPVAWTAAPDDMRAQIANAIVTTTNEAFEVSASGGTLMAHAAKSGEARRLALWIFSQRLGASLQPSRPFAGVMKGRFLPAPEHVEIIPIPDEYGRFPCRMPANGRLEYRIRVLHGGQSDADDGTNDRTWQEDELFLLEGTYQPSDGSAAVDLIRIAPKTTPST